MRTSRCSAATRRCSLPASDPYDHLVADSLGVHRLSARSAAAFRERDPDHLAVSPDRHGVSIRAVMDRLKATEGPNERIVQSERADTFRTLPSVRRRLGAPIICEFKGLGTQRFRQP